MTIMKPILCKIHNINFMTSCPACAEDAIGDLRVLYNFQGTMIGKHLYDKLISMGLDPTDHALTHKA
jgi:hypothetical protein